VAESEKTPVTGHGGAAAVDGEAPIVVSGEEASGTTGETNIVETGGGGLSPKLPISVEPKGIPTRPVANVG
jgi:hypothetical protein